MSATPEAPRSIEMTPDELDMIESFVDGRTRCAYFAFEQRDDALRKALPILRYDVSTPAAPDTRISVERANILDVIFALRNLANSLTGVQNARAEESRDRLAGWLSGTTGESKLSHAEIPSGMNEVTQDEFFAVIGPRDIVPRNERTFTVWETRSRERVGWSAPGWANPGEHPSVYALSGTAND